MPRLARITPLLTLLAFSAACSSDDDGSGLDEDQLTTQEAEALANAIFSLTRTTGFSAAKGGNAAASSAQVPITFSQSVAFTAACPLGGSVSISADMNGTIDNVTSAIDLGMDITETHQSCAVQDEDSGRQFTIDGDPSMATTLDMAVTSNGDFTLSGSYDGTLAWQSDGQSGRCVMNITFSASGNESSDSGSVSMNGTMCGVSISFSAST